MMMLSFCGPLQIVNIIYPRNLGRSCTYTYLHTMFFSKMIIYTHAVGLTSQTCFRVCNIHGCIRSCMLTMQFQLALYFLMAAPAKGGSFSGPHRMPLWELLTGTANLKLFRVLSTLALVDPTAGENWRGGHSSLPKYVNTTIKGYFSPGVDWLVPGRLMVPSLKSQWQILDVHCTQFYHYALYIYIYIST